jgi:hypothetical protein
LAFLLSGQYTPTFELTFNADLFSQTLLNHALFGSSIALKTWSRFRDFAEYYQLSAVIIQRSEDVKLWCEGEDPTQSLQQCVLSKLSPAAVQPLLSADWLSRLAATSRMIEDLNTTLVDKNSLHHPEAKTFFEALVIRLLTLSQDGADFYVLKTPDFKQLLTHCYYHPVLEDSPLRAPLKLALQTWATPKRSSYPPSILKDETTTVQASSIPSVERMERTVLNKLIKAVRQTIHLVTELSTLPMVEPYNKGLPCLLTRSELTFLAGIDFRDEAYHDDHRSLQSLLTVLQVSPFVDQTMQQQAGDLLIIMMNENDQSNRLAGVEHYCQCQSTQGQQAQGFFAFSAANDEAVNNRKAQDSSFYQRYQRT